eukprot:CAMPEP_0171717232 /NCGR_PEP_ID=MMETSP0991-20121206/19906_1 /TAXON_ID=483369 /ORGANISM="non described non described, Strain CCMP2098" /LENGTH=645 /DNA_ID=CAMNT_0012308401 /DNA_START=20 /DNA_END=1957 /DNA_ORIENTATION=-
MSAMLPPQPGGVSSPTGRGGGGASNRIKVYIPAATTRTDEHGKPYTTFLMEVHADVPVTPTSGESTGAGSATSPPPQFESKDWVVERRYSEFNRFHAAVKRRLPQLAVLPFPSKTYFFQMSEATIRHRQATFQRYVDILLSLRPIPSELFYFIEYSKYSQDFSGVGGGGGQGGLGLFGSPFGSSSSSSSDPANNALTQLIGARGPGKGVGLSDFNLIKVIGQGSFGKVFLVKPNWRVGAASSPSPPSSSSSAKQQQAVYAMKVVKKADVKRRNQTEHTMAERRIMALIRHPFVVPLLFAFQTHEKLYMVTEYCPGGELFFHLKRLKRFKEKDARFYVAEVACALSHIHACEVIYRDLKPENILLDAQGHVKLTDFGLSKDRIFDGHQQTQASRATLGGGSARARVGSNGSSEKAQRSHSLDGSTANILLNTTRTFCGTPEYLAPEMILNRKRQTGYSQAIDWWSLGIVAFEMLTGWPPFFDRNFNVMCEKILRKPVKLPAKIKVSDACDAFVCRGLLVRDPNQRLGSTNQGFNAIEKHAFYHDMDWQALRGRCVNPPFVPNRGRGSEDDTKNIDKEFLKMSAQETPTNAPSVLSQEARSASADGSVSGSMSRGGSESSAPPFGSGADGALFDHFEGFSFVDPTLG